MESGAIVASTLVTAQRMQQVIADFEAGPKSCGKSHQIANEKRAAVRETEDNHALRRGEWRPLAMANSKRERTPKTVLKLTDLEQSKSAVLNSRWSEVMLFRLEHEKVYIPSRVLLRMVDFGKELVYGVCGEYNSPILYVVNVIHGS
jgi:hypothetical protein